MKMLSGREYKTSAESSLHFRLFWLISCPLTAGPFRNFAAHLASLLYSRILYPELQVLEISERIVGTEHSGTEYTDWNGQSGYNICR